MTVQDHIKATSGVDSLEGTKVEFRDLLGPKTGSIKKFWRTNNVYRVLVDWDNGSGSSQVNARSLEVL